MKTDAQNHTPGPWKHANRGDYDTSGIGIFANNPAGMPYYVATAGFMGTADHRYAEANARLIASAPELLSALELFIERADEMIGLSDFGNPSESDFPLVQAREAIRKAKGE